MSSTAIEPENKAEINQELTRMIAEKKLPDVPCFVQLFCALGYEPENCTSTDPVILQAIEQGKVEYANHYLDGLQ